MMDEMQIGFIYCRTKPTHEEIKAINEFFINAHIVLGDFNLSHKLSEDKEKIMNMCKPRKKSVLDEITRVTSMNQLDYVLVDRCDNANSCSFSLMWSQDLSKSKYKVYVV